jgi:hypothetical protein
MLLPNLGTAVTSSEKKQILQDDLLTTQHGSQTDFLAVK